MVIEVTITIKDPDRTLRKDFLIYEPITLDPDDQVIAQCVKESVEEFKGIPDDIKLRATMVLQ